MWVKTQRGSLVNLRRAQSVGIVTGYVPDAEEEDGSSTVPRLKRKVFQLVASFEPSDAIVLAVYDRWDFADRQRTLLANELGFHDPVWNLDDSKIEDEAWSAAQQAVPF